jgi:hypothetical protein
VDDGEVCCMLVDGIKLNGQSKPRRCRSQRWQWANGVDAGAGVGGAAEDPASARQPEDAEYMKGVAVSLESGYR